MTKSSRRKLRKGRQYSDSQLGLEMDASIGVNLRVTAHSNQGGRKYMEDMFCVAYQPTADEKDLLYAYFGIFDGHGGREAALYAKTHLMDHIVSQKNFWSEEDELVLRSIKDGFISVHQAMWRELDKWPKTASGLPSTSGTTASVAFVRRGKLYVGHVGDSGIVLGYQDPNSNFWKARPLTQDHKPESPVENARIQECGGKVVSKSGVPRVVWNRPRIGHKGPVRRSTMIDEIPFLAVARSLGDLWSYNSEQNEFVVSPVPDTAVIEIDVNTHRCLILGSDGLWNMLSAQDAVNSVYFAEKNNERQNQVAAQMGHDGAPSQKNWINPSKRLVDRALDRWFSHNLRADNTSVVTVVIDPPGPPRVQKPSSPRHSSSSVSPERGSPTSRLSCAHTNNHGISPSHRFHRVIATTRYAHLDKHSSPRVHSPPQYHHAQNSPQQQPESLPQNAARHGASLSVGKPKSPPTLATNANRLRHQQSQSRDLPARGKRVHPAVTSKTSRVMQARTSGAPAVVAPATASTSNQNRLVAMSPSALLLSTLAHASVSSASSNGLPKDDQVQINEVSSSCEESWKSEASDLDDSVQVSSLQKSSKKKNKLRKGSKRAQPVPSTSGTQSVTVDKGRKRPSRQSTAESNEDCSNARPSKVLRLSPAEEEEEGTSTPTRRSETQKLVMAQQSHSTTSKLRHRARGSIPSDLRKSAVASPEPSTSRSALQWRPPMALARRRKQGAPVEAVADVEPGQTGFTDILPSTSRTKPPLQVTKPSRTAAASVPGSSTAAKDDSQDVRSAKVAIVGRSSRSPEKKTRKKNKKQKNRNVSASGVLPLNQKSVSAQPKLEDIDFAQSIISLRTHQSRYNQSLVNTISLETVTLKKSKLELKRLQKGKKLDSRLAPAKEQRKKHDGRSAPAKGKKYDGRSTPVKNLWAAEKDVNDRRRSSSVPKQIGRDGEIIEGRNLRSADIPPRMTRSQSVTRK